MAGRDASAVVAHSDAERDLMAVDPQRAASPPGQQKSASTDADPLGTQHPQRSAPVEAATPVAVNASTKAASALCTAPCYTPPPGGLGHYR